ncbi:MAG: TonB-dependent receptor [Pseudohongiellaceae bacterium]
MVSAAPPAFAQADGETGRNSIETIAVIGSRSPGRPVLRSPVAVDLLDQAQIDHAGAMAAELGEALSTLIPSFNYLRQSNSGTSDHVRAGQLRGMSPDQMLVLLNGKRRHTSAVVNTETKIGRGTAAVDFNTIPIGAIQRIEVLRDGAGAQYGSDAISGVINVILEDTPDGIEFNAGYGQHRTRLDAIDKDINDGETLTLSGKGGFSLSDGGFFQSGFELTERDATNRAGFDQIPFFIPATPANLAVQGQRNYRMGDPDVAAINLWYNGSISLGTSDIYSFATYGDRDTEGVTFFRYPEESRTVTELYPEGFLPVTLGENRDYSATLGLRSNLERWTLDNSVTLGGNRFAYGAKNSLNASLGPASPRRFDSGEYRVIQRSVNLDLRRENPIEGRLGMWSPAAGLEYRREEFRSRAGESASWQPGDFDGDIGAQGALGLTPQDATNGAREVYSAYAELSSQLTEALVVDVAARLENYSDLGEELTGKLSGAYSFNSRYTLRAAVSNSLRAPSMSQLGFADRSINFGENRTLVTTVTLPVDGSLAQAFGAKNLKAETAINRSIGFVTQPLDGLSVMLDVYYIELEDRVTLSERLFGEELADFVQALPGGAGIESVRFFTNAVDTRTGGADLILAYSTSVGAGELSVTGGYNYSQNRITGIAPPPDQLRILDPSFVLVGVEEENTLEESAPAQKANLSVNWSDSRWGLTGRLHYFGSTVRVFNFGGGFEPRQRYGSEYAVDFETRYTFSDMLSLTLGVNNAFDNYPDRSGADINFFGNLPHDVLSPVGVNGRYVYSNIKVQF